MKTMVVNQLFVGDRLGNFIVIRGGDNQLYLCHIKGDFSVPVSDVKIEFKLNQNETESKKPRYVNLIRYIRPKDKYGQIDNMQGVTLRIQLDYVEQTINYSYAICKDENFDKMVGCRIANTRWTGSQNQVFTIPMNNGKVSENGVVHDIVHSLSCPREIKKMYVRS